MLGSSRTRPCDAGKAVCLFVFVFPPLFTDIFQIALFSEVADVPSDVTLQISFQMSG